MSAWVTIVVSVISAISGALLTILTNEVILKPVLAIEQMEDRFFDHKTQLTYHRIIVRNVGRRAAQNCNVSIELNNIEKHHLVAPDASTIIGPDSFVDEQPMSFHRGLHWAEIDNDGRNNPITVSINKQYIMKINIFKVKQGLNPPIIFVFSEKSGQYLLKLAAIGKQEYKGQILITSSNANPRKINFRLVPSHEGDPSCPTDIKLIIDNVSPKLWPPILRQLIPGQ